MWSAGRERTAGAVKQGGDTWRRARPGRPNEEVPRSGHAGLLFCPKRRSGTSCYTDKPTDTECLSSNVVNFYSSSSNSLRQCSTDYPRGQCIETTQVQPPQFRAGHAAGPPEGNSAFRTRDLGPCHQTPQVGGAQRAIVRVRGDCNVQPRMETKNAAPTVGEARKIKHPTFVIRAVAPTITQPLTQLSTHADNKQPIAGACRPVPPASSPSSRFIDRKYFQHNLFLVRVYVANRTFWKFCFPSTLIYFPFLFPYVPLFS